MVECTTRLEHMRFAVPFKRAWGVEIAAERYILTERRKWAAAGQNKACAGQTEQGLVTRQRVVRVE
jgi:hypothetical protein